MATQFKLRRDTATNWTSNNPTLASGEPGVETDTNKFKIGNGTTPWVSLPYFPAAFDAAAITSGTVPIGRGGTGQTSFSSGFVKSNGTSLSGGNAITAADITSTEQAAIVAGKVRSGGVVGGSPITLFVQSATPTANATGDLWFW